ncbi:hypothetical protein LQ938_02755 [Microbacterium sp. cx-55]|uniref:hypothetical protein n=1 Tax=Microbacterium sp. cx-55 TaxID=2875948 RepID=UPI001CBF5D1C|nr:hypothetical protein [Microbacterium sp. cx-55]MBZ4486809.1 hypothetical protein [Microbacterium sp. cx-55]UGB35739.1 hypothetical protein LQ938_02755 [Microbacterium sp. cx-55]
MADGERGKGYWITQISVLGGFGVVSLATGIFLWVTDFDNHAGDGFMALLVSILFFAVLYRVTRMYRAMSEDQRAAYAWAITQMHAAGVGSDRDMMAVAARARAGTLEPDEVRALETMRPGHPYPGGAHPQGQARPGPRQYDTPRQATAWTAATITGFVLSFLPVLALIGFVLSAASFRHLGRTVQPRRLALAGILISIVMIAATIALLAYFAALGNASICADLGPGVHLHNGHEYTCE